MTKKEKLTTLNRIRGELDKGLGGGKLMFASDPSLKIKKISSGSLSLDRALGGGFALKKSVLLWGESSSTKTALALKTVANAQGNGMECAFIETEKSLDTAWAQNLGVDLDRLMVNRPDYAEQAIDLMQAMLKTEAFGVIVLDSIAALEPKAESDDSAEQQQMGLQARLMSKALRKLTAVNQDTLIIFINQVREKVGVTFGSPKVEPGGKAMGFYASQRVYLAKGGAIKEKSMVFDSIKMVKVEREITVGHVVRAQVEKDKTQAPLRQAEFIWSHQLADIDRLEEIMALGIEDGLITRSGNFFSYEGQKYNGRAKFKGWLGSDPVVAEDLAAKIATKSERVDKAMAKEEGDGGTGIEVPDGQDKENGEG